ncbi:hypothetical protein K8352_01175 [Flavobacteriaceae bacterium F89]|uniref:Uncharacterized protein n=1 Tax=Cerina litoralis TaxID=2874477 RepID=A0AAE3ESH9_9FLAO|nr:hypothetical protein [Cerina litoralis]MCG2459354.1 hypothetical protein [Cerina litoralis]
MAKPKVLMHRNYIRFTLLFLWVFAIVAPTVITLVERNPKSVVMNTLNEEEHQNQGKKVVGEKEIAFDSFNYQSLLAFQNGKISCEISSKRLMDRALEILLPPPRHPN